MLYPGRSVRPWINLLMMLLLSPTETATGKDAHSYCYREDQYP